MVPAEDPTVVRSIAVTAGDVVTAVVARRSTSRQPVLRLTPPFSGRMRARIHVLQRHHDRHARAVADWRAPTADAIRERATIDVPSGPHEVAVVVLDGGAETG